MSLPETMKVCVLAGLNDLKLEERPLPMPGPGEVLVRVHAAGVCGSDLQRVFVSGAYHYPLVLGHEFAGQVVAVSEGEEAWQGKRVAVFPLLPCFHCASCSEGNYAQCRQYDYYGSRRDGGFAEYVSIRTWNLLALPDSVSFAEAALFEPAAVALHALRQAGELAGRSLCLIGVGTIGLILARLARLCGCRRVLLVTRSREKTKIAEESGFDFVFDSSKDDVTVCAEAATGGEGPDIVVEGCGHADALCLAVRLAAPNGRIVCLGNPVEAMALNRQDYWRILRRQLRICGTWNSSFKIPGNDWQAILDMVSDGRLGLQEFVTDRYPLSETRKAFDELWKSSDGRVRLKTLLVSREDA